LLALAISGRGVDEQYLEATFRAISNVYPIPSRLPTNLQGWSVAKDALRAVHEGWHGIG